MITIILVIVGILIAVFIENGLEKNDLWRKVSFGIIGGIIGAILPLLFEIPQTNKEYNDTMKVIDENLKNSNILYSTKSKIFNIKEENIKSFFDNGIKDIEEKLFKIKNENILHIEKDYVFSVWRKIILNSKKGDKIYATNIVSYYDWGNFDISNGESIQKEAIDRNVKIVRIYFSDAKVKNHAENTKRLYFRDKKNKIEAYNIPISIASSVRYSQYFQKLKSYDLVLLNEELLLITFTDEESRLVKYSYLTNDADLIKTAATFFKELHSEVKSMRK